MAVCSCGEHPHKTWCASNDAPSLQRNPRRAYRVVDDFERELQDYTGAPYAVAVDSCTNALFLSLMWERRGALMSPTVVLPRRTYVGVLQAARNAHYRVEWRDEPDNWQVRGLYNLHPTAVWDSARRLSRGMFIDFAPFPSAFVCVSFNAKKQLALGNGGAILTDDPAAAEFLRAARMDGRPPGTPASETLPRGWHCPLAPPVAALGLWRLSDWVDKGFEPAPLPEEEYPDLSRLEAK